MKITEINGSVRVSEIEYFSVAQTFDCGQCFRFTEEENGVSGFALGKAITIRQLSENEIEITPCTKNEFESEWMEYLGLSEDYAAIRAELSEMRKGDTALSASMETGKGIRILRQPKWETLCSFIISQNNNIPRIKKLIAALCAEGNKISGAGENVFPSPETLLAMGQERIFALKTGFRAAYLYDAAQKVTSGEVDLDKVASLPYSEAAAELCKIKGVGPKVAACTLLFGFGKYDAFPVDVWVKRLMEEYYGGMVSGADFGRYAGIAQQYLFYNRRYVEAGKK